MSDTLCVWCITEAWTPTMHAVLWIAEGTELHLRTVHTSRGEELRVSSCDMPVSGQFAGRPLEWAAFLRELVTVPRERWRLDVNSSQVGVSADTQLWGTWVCAAHIHPAMELWTRRGYTYGQR